MSRQFVSFTIAGGIAAAANFGSRFIFDVWTSYSVAVVLAYLVGMATAFILVRSFVFVNSSLPIRSSAMWFVLVNLLACAQTWLVSIGLAELVFPSINYTFHPKALAHAIGIVVPVFISFLGHRQITFR